MAIAISLWDCIERVQPAGGDDFFDDLHVFDFLNVIADVRGGFGDFLLFME
jgi:hypothetical protein